MSRYTADKRWRRTRRHKLAATPTCERCTAAATQVHHRDGLGLDGPLAYAPENLEALCQSCHSKITNRFGPGAKKEPRRRPDEAHPGEAPLPEPPGIPLA